MTDKVTKGLILVIVNVVMMINNGLVFSFGALFVRLMETLRTDRATTVTIQSLLIGVTMGFGMISGTLISWLGLPTVTMISSVMIPLGFILSFFIININLLYFGIGIISAVGFSMMYISGIVTIGRVCTGNLRFLFLSIMHMLIAISSLVYPYLLTWLTSEYGLYGTFLILGGVTCNNFAFYTMCRVNRNVAEDINTAGNTAPPCDTAPPCAAEINTDVAEDNHKVSKCTSVCVRLYSHANRLISVPYISLLLATSTCLSSLNGYQGMLLDISRGQRFTETQGLGLLLAYNITNIISRILPGLLKQRKGINSFIYPIVSTLCGFIGQLLLYFSDGYELFITGCALSGMAFGGIVSSAVNNVVKMVHSEQVSIATGLGASLTGVMSIAVGPIFGSLRDRTGSYGSVLLTVSAMQAFSGFLHIFAMECRRRQEKSKESLKTIKTIEIISGSRL